MSVVRKKMTILTLSLGFILNGGVLGFIFWHQLQEKKLSVICQGHLQHLFTARKIHLGENDLNSAAIEVWPEDLVSLVSYPQVLHCPSVAKPDTSKRKKKKITYGDKRLYGENLENSFPIFQKTWLFDAKVDSSEKASPHNLANTIAFRHLGKSNFLQLDGAVLSFSLSQFSSTSNVLSD